MTKQAEMVWAMMPALPWTSLKEEEKALVAHTIDLIKKDAEKAVLDRLDTIPMNPVIDIAFEKWRVLLTGDMVRGIVRAALEAKP